MERENTIIRENTYKQEIRDFLLLFFRWTQYFFFIIGSHDFAFNILKYNRFFFLSLALFAECLETDRFVFIPSHV